MEDTREIEPSSVTQLVYVGCISRRLPSTLERLILPKQQTPNLHTLPRRHTCRLGIDKGRMWTLLSRLSIINTVPALEQQDLIRVHFISVIELRLRIVAVIHRLEAPSIRDFAVVQAALLGWHVRW